MSKYKLYAAYGSNTNINHMETQCPNSVVVGTGKIEDYKLEFRSFANIAPCKGKEVPVVIWAITEEDELNLDYYEGVSWGLYLKEELKVKVKNISDTTILIGNKSDSVVELMALVYVMGEKKKPVQAPDAFYYGLIVEGYKRNQLDTYPLTVAAIFSSGKIE